jgi:hypothetical protein
LAALEMVKVACLASFPQLRLSNRLEIGKLLVYKNTKFSYIRTMQIQTFVGMAVELKLTVLPYEVSHSIPNFGNG